jgi:hypothetical protein
MFRQLALLACLVGCGGGGVSFENLPDEIEDAQCGQAVACQRVTDRPTCEAAFELDGGLFGSIEAAIADGTIKYDADAAGACADSFGGTDCKFGGFHEDNPCDGVFTGTVPTGGACVIDLQCANLGECVATSPSCDPDTACCPGTCMGSTIESQIGGPCDETHFCGVDAYCKEGTTTGVCTALVASEGAACDSIVACANPRYCNLDFGTGTGTCKTPAASGAACLRTDLIPCADSRDHCDPTTLECVRDVAVGATCGDGVQCIGFASCVNSVCLADIPLGGACQADGADCAGDLECVSGTCQMAPPSMTCSLP